MFIVTSAHKKLVSNPELLIQERFQRLAKFQTIVHGKKTSTQICWQEMPLSMLKSHVFLGWFSKMECPLGREG